MDKNWISLLQSNNRLSKVMNTNVYTEQFGLMLSQQDAELILASRLEELRTQERVEFGEGIAEKIIRQFCDSSYIDQNNYVDTIIRLQEIFYLYKNEMHDEITDDELLHLMKEQYEELCFGNLEYLETTCLANFAKAIRAGYDGYKATDGYGEAQRFDIQERWSYELYYETLRELLWG